ncbi:MAG: tRNA pseudouridine(38-40) synthase TruA [Coriobacteriales bacterium]|jgi:tRNA pseudouridine38-40 synthase|nr:tRNA pseudouridine(38-40) synthase TruA [Coriobacteriales bacterium]
MSEQQDMMPNALKPTAETKADVIGEADTADIPDIIEVPDTADFHGTTDMPNTADIASKPDTDNMLDEKIISLTISYKGSAFHGFARQPKQTTVQGELEKALKIIFRHDIETVGAGRTDTGVHALGQVVSFALTTTQYQQRFAQCHEFSGFQAKRFTHSGLLKLASSLNAITPDEIVVCEAHLRPPGFSARFSAKEREYRYRICTSSTAPLFLSDFAWWLRSDKPLDIIAMREACTYLLGEKDFRSFCVAKSAKEISTMRNINQAFVFCTQHLGERCTVVQIKGNAFLHSMVRVIVGSLVEVGLRQKNPDWINQILLAKDRRAAGCTAPAHGLTLWKVKY